MIQIYDDQFSKNPIHVHSRQMEQQKEMTAVHSNFKKPVDQCL